MPCGYNEQSNKTESETVNAAKWIGFGAVKQRQKRRGDQSHSHDDGLLGTQTLGTSVKNQ